ncbi:alcohol dehydrogenase catalytic domain-containing protein, partial [Arthrobacter sp. UCD-GKA]|uniref:alcohol dehydrogenase catalytic domain-containing protein n=1 Tax=Arthrobacter sp. UCD-GKA TaxID=1913576 RepID=UPI0015872CF1
MPGNKAVAYVKPGVVEVIDTPYPTFELQDGPGVNPSNIGRKVPHGAILRTVATNICGSDQHMVRGRTTAPAGLVLGHEITGEVIETGPDVEFLKVGDIVSVPFNISCGRCRNCKEAKTGICLNVNPDRPGSAYGYVDMGGWVGGQAEYVLVPYADWNLLKFPDRDQAVPFNISCGRCRNCKEAKTGICLNVNPDRPGSAYGYVDMGGWVGGQAEYVLVPYADWNLLKFPDRDQA